MPDRLLGLGLLVGFWIPPAMAGRAAAEFAHRRRTRVRPALMYAGLTTFVVGWSALWFLINQPQAVAESHDYVSLTSESG
ncbi:MAG TPA: hypothetical protein VGQ52_19675 [Gemmatimonadaceae bacterium]|nr:hypothetical protein [Gemmatimonadaceae bacterium]